MMKNNQPTLEKLYGDDSIQHRQYAGSSSGFWRADKHKCLVASGGR